MKRIIRASVAAASVLALGVPGIVAANTGSLDTTGPDSNNEVTFHNGEYVTVHNNNDIRVNSRATQRASSGDAKAYDNTTAGDASSGSAMNDNAVSASVTVDNSAASSMGGGGGGGDSTATISTTGPDSNNVIKEYNTSRTTITNRNEVNVSNNVSQSAYSGDATVSHNTTGGSATTGDASNTSSTTFEFSFMN